MNRDILEGKWRELRGQIKAKWGQITDDELDEIGGNYDALVGRIQQKYGYAREEVERDLDNIVTERSTVR
jgi:uncharacterized protein YjbJ (UPF0337 family)